jgi:APA family basic amino acid/polyamine antiporter
MQVNANKPQLFVRQASGLVREFNISDTFVFNVLGFALGLVLAIAPTFLGGLYPNANVYMVITLGTILALFNGLTYGLFAAAMPRSGGDYVYIGRTLSPSLGFISNWGFSWSQFLGLGVYTAWTVQTALSPALSTFGYATGRNSFVELGSRVAEPAMIWGIGTLLLISVLLISIGGLRILKRFLNLLFLLAIAGTLVTLGLLLTTSHQEFVAAFNDFMLKNAQLPDAYNAIINLGRQNGLVTGGTTSFWQSVLALPVGYWVYIGFTYSVYIGGEVKEPQRTQSFAIIGALLFGYVLYMLILGQYYAVVGRDFNNAVAIVQNLKDSPLPVGGSMSFFTGILTRNVLLNVLMGVSTFLWFYLLLFVMTTFCVRNIFAWSFDQITPKVFTKVTKKQGAPWAATLLIIALAELFLTLQAFVGIAFINYIAMFSVCFLITGIAAIMFPYRKPHLFASAPAIVRRRIGGLPLIVIAGVGNVLLFAIILYSSLTNPGVSGVQGWLPTVIVGGVYLLGALVYYIARAVRRGQGVDFSLLYVEMPPE